MPPRLKRTACWRNRYPDPDNFSTPCRLAENASAGAEMAAPSLPRPPALHRSIGPDRGQYNLLDPRRGIVMRLVQSMVPTQECPRSSFSCPRWAWRRPSGPTAPRNGNMSHPTRRMKFNPGRNQFLSLQPLSVYISKLSQQGASIHIEINWQKTKLLAVSISYSEAFSMGW
jgi:hypothetical protein